VLGFQIEISLGALGCVKANTPRDMARRPLHEPIRAMVLLPLKGSMLVLLPVKGWLIGTTAVVGLDTSSSSIRSW